jgi:hypothetical protein
MMSNALARLSEGKKALDAERRLMNESSNPAGKDGNQTEGNNNVPLAV